MPDEARTKPTIETLLERMQAMEERLTGRIESLEQRLNVRLDRIESLTRQTRSEFLTPRADFTEFRAQFKQPA